MKCLEPRFPFILRSCSSSANVLERSVIASQKSASEKLASEKSEEEESETPASEKFEEESEQVGGSKQSKGKSHKKYFFDDSDVNLDSTTTDSDLSSLKTDSTDD